MYFTFYSAINRSWLPGAWATEPSEAEPFALRGPRAGACVQLDTSNLAHLLPSVLGRISSVEIEI